LPSAASLSRMYRSVHSAASNLGRLTHRSIFTASSAKLPQENSRLVRRRNGYPQARLPCRRGGSNPRCSPECSTIIHASLFAAYLTTASTIRSLLSAGEAYGVERVLITKLLMRTVSKERNFVEICIQRNGTGPAPSFWIRPLLGSTTFGKSNQSV
jgi:hypothetical protein